MISHARLDPRSIASQGWEPRAMATVEAAPSRVTWRTPAVIIVCGCAMAMLSFGPRSALGFFLTPMSQENGWGRDVFSLALAMQNLLWGVAQPFAGAIADRYGALRVLSGGATMYVLGLLVQRGAGSVRQAVARAVALARIRRRNGRRLVRPVPVLPARGVPEGRA